MPHFIIECSEDILNETTPKEILQVVYAAAEASALFSENDIKVRLNPYKYYQLGAVHSNFIHIFGHIMEGRSSEQKAALSRLVIEKVNELVPAVSLLSMNVRDFASASYCNKFSIAPLNSTVAGSSNSDPGLS